MPTVKFPLHGPDPAGDMLGVPAILFGRIPLPAEQQADNTTNIFVNPVLPLPLMFKGPGKLRNRFPLPPFAAPWIDPPLAPAPTMPQPIVFAGIGAKAFGRLFGRALFSGTTPTRLTISGISRDSAGAILVSATVKLFRSDNDVLVETTISDAVTGAFTFYNVGLGDYWEVGYKVGVPDITGATLRSLRGVIS